MKSNDGGSTSKYYLQGLYGATDVNASGTKTYSVDTKGNVAFSSWFLQSDERYKKLIKTAKTQWEDIKNFRLVSYQWKKHAPMGMGECFANETKLGLLAQQVEKIDPSCVETRMDDDPDPKTRKVKEVLNEENYLDYREASQVEVKSLKVESVMFKMLGALQEAQKRIEELEGKLETILTA